VTARLGRRPASAVSALPLPAPGAAHRASPGATPSGFFRPAGSPAAQPPSFFRPGAAAEPEPGRASGAGAWLPHARGSASGSAAAAADGPSAHPPAPADVGAQQGRHALDLGAREAMGFQGAGGGPPHPTLAWGGGAASAPQQGGVPAPDASAADFFTSYSDVVAQPADGGGAHGGHAGAHGGAPAGYREQAPGEPAASHWGGAAGAAGEARYDRDTPPWSVSAAAQEGQPPHAGHHHPAWQAAGGGGGWALAPAAWAGPHGGAGPASAPGAVVEDGGELVELAL